LEKSQLLRKSRDFMKVLRHDQKKLSSKGKWAYEGAKSDFEGYLSLQFLGLRAKEFIIVIH
jgi:hypothetical protein